MGEDKKKSFTVLVVEDEPVIRDVLSQLLTEQGVRVIALPDPTNQIEVMLREKNTLDLVISGIMYDAAYGRYLYDKENKGDTGVERHTVGILL